MRKNNSASPNTSSKINANNSSESHLIPSPQEGEGVTTSVVTGGAVTTIVVTGVALYILLILSSWLYSAAVPTSSIRPILSDSGIRWFFGTFVSNLCNPLLIYIILLDIAIGACLHTGLIPRPRHFFRPCPLRLRLIPRLLRPLRRRSDCSVAVPGDESPSSPAHIVASPSPATNPSSSSAHVVASPSPATNPSSSPLSTPTPGTASPRTPTPGTASPRTSTPGTASPQSSPQSSASNGGLLGTLFVLLFELAVVLLLTLPRHAILLSATGTLFPSSFSASIVPIIAFMLLSAAIAYGLFSGTLHNFRDTVACCISGGRNLKLLLVVYVLAMELWKMVEYVVGG